MKDDEKAGACAKEESVIMDRPSLLVSAVIRDWLADDEVAAANWASDSAGGSYVLYPAGNIMPTKAPPTSPASQPPLINQTHPASSSSVAYHGLTPNGIPSTQTPPAHSSPAFLRPNPTTGSVSFGTTIQAFNMRATVSLPRSQIASFTPITPLKPSMGSSSHGSGVSGAGSATTVPVSNRTLSQGGGLVASSSSSSSSSEQRKAMLGLEREMKKQKERFLIFTRVLMKYLEHKDLSLHLKVKRIIKDCAERNKRQEPGYKSVTASMKIRLKQIVSVGYWKRAEAYLEDFLRQKGKSTVQGPVVSSKAPSGGMNRQGATDEGNNKGTRQENTAPVGLPAAQQRQSHRQSTAITNFQNLLVSQRQFGAWVVIPTPSSDEEIVQQTPSLAVTMPPGLWVVTIFHAKRLIEKVHSHALVAADPQGRALWILEPSSVAATATVGADDSTGVTTSKLTHVQKDGTKTDQTIEIDHESVKGLRSCGKYEEGGVYLSYDRLSGNDVCITIGYAGLGKASVEEDIGRAFTDGEGDAWWAWKPAEEHLPKPTEGFPQGTKIVGFGSH